MVRTPDVMIQPGPHEIHEEQAHADTADMYVVAESVSTRVRSRAATNNRLARPRYSAREVCIEMLLSERAAHSSANMRGTSRKRRSSPSEVKKNEATTFR